MGQHDKTTEKTTSSPGIAPAAAARDVVVYRTWSSRCSSGGRSPSRPSRRRCQDNKQILLVAQKSADVDDPAAKI